ncbi:MAG: hypothetical protein K6T81_14075 [Alicyclobacillus macrosporangiidus]|uniref:hypothetical protein n=1 Tax=Alicyclobacillus macrosporangiidus TaxID=392015 RepID=UPI0026EE451C|nr:hypothetical protein [Alicyclobacillus macrosporangiidus]MCL6599844.1 hypothetical protein [Alicyclobacillus macrosporangiidus]
MQRTDVWAILFCALFALAVFRSLLNRMGQGSQVPLEGHYQAARRWLEDNGYTIVAVHPQCEWHGYYGNEHYQWPLTADFIVRQGARYFAVILARERSETVTETELRAEWYPVSVAFGVHGLLHMDVDGEQVHQVDFELTHPPSLRWRRIVNRSLWFLGGMLAALALFHGV